MNEKDEWEVDFDRRQLRRGQVVVPVGGRAFDIIAVLVEAAGELVSKSDVMARVWPGAFVEDNTLQVHISAVRRALGSERSLLRTASGRGYRLLGDWRIRRDGRSPGDVDGRAMGTSGFQSNLPQRSSDLIGRSNGVQQLRDLISAYRLVTLTGPGGIGKTKLAQEVARELCPQFENNVQLVELAPISDPDLASSAVANILGLHTGGNQVLPSVLAQAIGDQKLLLVVDNCEHVIDAAARCVETILRQCAHTTVLATSRELLRIDGEFAYPVTPLDVPEASLQAVDIALEHSAMRLFCARMLAARADFAVNEENLSSVIAICRRLDGIPLAIELAAARAATLGIEEVVCRLDDRFGLLSGGRRTALPRHRTLRAMLDWSYDLLTNTERTILRRLAVFAGGFTLDSACAVAAATDANVAETVDGIVSLSAKSLIDVEPATGQPRYVLLETVRAYAFEKLAEAGELGATRLRHAQYFQALFGQAEAERESRPIDDWLATYGREIDNVRGAIDWALSVKEFASLAVELSADSISLMFDLSLVGEGRRRAEQALSAIQSGVPAHPRREMQLLGVLRATGIYTDGPSAAGFEAWERVLAIAVQLGDLGYQVRALWGLWNDHLYGGWPAGSLAFANRFLELTATCGDPAIAAIGAVLGPRIIGTSLHYLGEQAAARPHLEYTLSHYVRGDHRWRVLGSRLDQATVTRATLARVLWLEGYPDQALRLTERAMRDAIADDHLMSILYVLVEAAIPLSLFAGDPVSTRRFVGMLLDQAPRAGFRIWQTYGRSFRAVLVVAGGDLAAGLPALVQAVRELEETGFCAHLTMFLGVLAQAEAGAGAITDGLRSVNRALDWCESHDERWFTAELLRIRSDILALGADDTEAAAELGRALDLSRRQGARSWELRAATSLARLLRRQGKNDQARAILAPIRDWFTEGFETADLCAAGDLLVD